MLNAWRRLVLVHHLNGNSLEKFYYSASVAVVAILNITPYAAGQFGYYNGTCWFSDPHPDVQFRWLLWSQAVWMLLMSTGEIVSFFMILGYMYRASHICCEIMGVADLIDVQMHRVRVWSNHTTASTFLSRPIPDSPIVVYRTVILRIGLH